MFTSNFQSKNLQKEKLTNWSEHIMSSLSFSVNISKISFIHSPSWPHLFKVLHSITKKNKKKDNNNNKLVKMVFWVIYVQKLVKSG